MKMSLFDFLASSRASGPHICHATGLFMWPRTYGLRLSFSRFVSFSPSPEGADAPGMFCASILSIDVWSLRSCARDANRGVVAACEGIRAVRVVEITVRAEEQGPLRLNRTGGIQQRKSRRCLGGAYSWRIAATSVSIAGSSGSLAEPSAPPPPKLRNRLGLTGLSTMNPDSESDKIHHVRMTSEFFYIRHINDNFFTLTQATPRVALMNLPISIFVILLVFALLHISHLMWQCGFKSYAISSMLSRELSDSGQVKYGVM